MTRNFDEEIQAAERGFETILSQMDRVQQDFLAAAIQFVKSWFWEHTELIVKQKPEVTKQLGIRLSQLKADVKKLQENAATIVAEYFQDGDLWWHQNQAKQSYNYYGRRPPEHLDKALRLCLGRLASVFEGYGYLSTEPQDHGRWREWDKSGNYQPADAKPYYPFNLDWTEQMQVLVKKYGELHGKGIQQAMEIKRLKDEKAESEAKDLWDKA
jgi:hypothetical protein